MKRTLAAFGFLASIGTLLIGQDRPQQPSDPRDRDTMIRVLIQLMEGEDSVLASHATRELGRMGESALEALMGHVRNGKPDGEAIRKRIGRLIELLEADEIATREEAWKELVSLGKHAVPALKKVADEGKSTEARERARQALKAIFESPERVSPRTAARRSSVSLVGAMAGRKPLIILPFLLELMEDADEAVRQAAFLALKRTTAQHIDFDSGGEEDKRAKALAKWKTWWEANRARVESDPEFLRGERKKVVKKLLVRLTDGTALRVDPPKQPLSIATRFGALQIPWSNLVSLRATDKEAYELVTDHATLAGGIELAGGDLVFNDGYEDVSVSAAQVAGVAWVTLGGADETFLGGNTLLVSYHVGHVVQEIDGSGKVVWEYRHQSPYSAQRLADGNTLMSFYNGGPVVEVDGSGKIVWQRQCNDAVDAKKLPSGNYLISEYTGKRVIEVNPRGDIVWQRGLAGNGYEADRLPNGNTLISSPGETPAGGSVLEVDPAGAVVWRAGDLACPVSADRLENGNTLITDTGGRVVEMDGAGRVVWQRAGLSTPYDAHRLPNGNTLIAETSAGRVIEVEPSGKIVWQKALPNALRAYR